MSEQSHDFVVSRFIKARRSLVWDAWTMPEQLAQWWCPKPITCRVTNFNLHPGGAFDIMMRDPSGQEMPQTGAFLDVVHQERIIFTTALTSNWRPAPMPLPITGIITMADEDDGTRYETRVLYIDEEERQKLAQMRFEAGWSQAIDQLDDLVSD